MKALGILWCVNAVLFCLAWFGGDWVLSQGDMFAESIHAMRITLGCTKGALSFVIFFAWIGKLT